MKGNDQNKLEDVARSSEKIKISESSFLNEKDLKEEEGKNGLIEAIREQVYPCMVSIQTTDGSIATGFFQTRQWLVSNAHLIPDIETLIEASFSDFEMNHIDFGLLSAERVFHRPNNDISPDIVMVKNFELRNKYLEMGNIGDENFEEECIFYPYYDRGSKIEHLTLYSKSNECPIIYECKENIPKPGCSGSPVIKAKRLNGNWKFQAIGIVYARQRFAEITGSKLLYTIPVDKELSQIEDIISFEARASESKQKAKEYEKKDIQKAKHYGFESQLFNEHALRGFRQFLKGKTELNINVPYELEKLYGKNILDIQGSALYEGIHNRFKRAGVEEEPVGLEELTRDLYKLLEQIARKDLLFSNPENFQPEDEFIRTKYFRIDVIKNQRQELVFDVQDNVGKGIHIDKQPVSSKFATAKMLFQDIKKITGRDLVAAFMNGKEKNNRFTNQTKEQLLIVLNEKKKRKEKRKQEQEKEKSILPGWRLYCGKHGNLNSRSFDQQQKAKRAQSSFCCGQGEIRRESFGDSSNELSDFETFLSKLLNEDSFEENSAKHETKLNSVKKKVKGPA